jgi:hypothetical protein
MSKLITQFDGCGEFDPGTKSEADHEIARKALAVLQMHYGAYIWVISCNSQQGVLTIGLPDICNWVYVVKLNLLWSDPGMKSVVRGAGEFLERYKIPRSNLAMNHIYQIMHERPIAHRQGPPQ